MNPLKAPRSNRVPLALPAFSLYRAVPAWVALGAIAPASLVGMSVVGGANSAIASSLPTQSCAYDPGAGKPNPLDGRAFVSINEIEGDTIFTYQELPSVIQADNKEIAVSQQREISIPNTPIEQARNLLLTTPRYYNELLGYESSNGFAAVNNSLTCWSNNGPTASLPARVANFSTTPSPDNPSAPVLADPRPAVIKPTPGAVQPSPAAPPAAAPPAAVAPPAPPLVTTQPSITTPPKPPVQAPNVQAPAAPQTTAVAVPRSNPIGNLPDGNYRVWNGQAVSPEVSDAMLLEQGGALFIFRKEGNKVTGNFAYIDGEDSACVFGFINNDTVSGFAYPYDNEVRPVEENFINLGPSDYLQVRRASQQGNVNFYRSALLNLKEFNPIALGPVSPPTSCQS